jgi:hypothetical protein
MPLLNNLQCDFHRSLKYFWAKPVSSNLGIIPARYNETQSVSVTIKLVICIYFLVVGMEPNPETFMYNKYTLYC